MPAAPTPSPRVCIVSPARAGANNGNWRTASRWRHFLAPVGPVQVRDTWYDESDGDLLIALHARRAAESIERFRARYPAGPIVLVLTGTDLYRDLEIDARARHSLECASRIVVLQERGPDGLDAASRARTCVIVQSAPALHVAREPGDADFVAVGHLRAEKDPQTIWEAARRLAGEREPLRIIHIGAALDPALAAGAGAAMDACPGYRWLGALPHARTRRIIATARALVHPSRMEGGAHVVIEAVRSGVPVLASRIDGNVGLLGEDYAGYFAAGDAASLAALMRRFARDAAFAVRLVEQCALREPLFRPAAERRALRALLAELAPAPAFDLTRATCSRPG